MHSTLRVLVVEDDQATCQLLESALSVHGFLADSVATAELALDRLAWEHFDGLIVDKNLPGIDGVTCIERVRRFDNVMACVLITGDPTLESAVDTLQLGVDAYVPKPIDDISAFAQNLQRLILQRRVSSGTFLPNKRSSDNTELETDTLAAWRQLAVLIVCHDTDDQRRLATWFEGAGDTVDLRGLEDQVVSTVFDHQPDVLILDAALPTLMADLEELRHVVDGPAVVLLVDEPIATRQVIELIDLSVRAIVRTPLTHDSIEGSLGDLLHVLRLTPAEPIVDDDDSIVEVEGEPTEPDIDLSRRRRN